MDIKLTINGDLCIFLEDCTACKTCWEGNSETSISPNEKKEEYDMHSQLVAVIEPGELLEVLTYEEADEVLYDFYEICEADASFGGSNMTLFYHKGQVLTLCGERYLMGPAVLCRLDDSNRLASLTEKNLRWIAEYLAENSVLYTATGKKIPAIRLPE